MNQIPESEGNETDKKNVFVSDLDKTLIYSGDTTLGNVKVEDVEGHSSSYMHPETMRMLKSMCDRGHFIPCTTRSSAQFSRLQLQQHGLSYQYAITESGGTIWVDGKPDLEWQQHIQEALTGLGIDQLKLQNQAEDILSALFSPGCVLKKRSVTTVFTYMVLDLSLIPNPEILEGLLTQQLPIEVRKNIRVSLSGRKLYLIPTCIDKGLALDFLARKYHLTVTVASGDSDLDMGMLDCAHFVIIPAHSEKNLLELTNKKVFSNPEKFSVTLKSGLVASCEIAAFAFKKILQAPV